MVDTSGWNRDPGAAFGTDANDQIADSRYGGMTGVVKVPGTTDVFYDTATGKIVNNPVTGAAPVDKTPKPASGGGGGGGGGASISPGQLNSYKDFYAQWYGDAWVTANMAIVQSAATRALTDRQVLQEIANRGAGNTPYAVSVVNYIRSVVGPLPLSNVMQIIGSGLWLESDFETRIAPQFQKDVLSNPQSTSFVDLWNRYTAAATLGPTAQAKLKEIIDRFGYTDAGMQQWELWLTTTESATKGNYGAQKRFTIGDIISGWLGREPTEDELSPTGPYWDMIGGTMGAYDTSALQETIRGTDEYKTRFAAKSPGETEEQYLGWEFSINAEGNRYFNDKPGVDGIPRQDNFTGYGPEQLKQLKADGWTGMTLRGYHDAVEEAIFQQGVNGPMVIEAFGQDLTDDEWFALANNGKGSGALRAQLVEANNRIQFREAYRQVFGNDPDPSDYARITQEYVSPAELIRETQALESAKEMYPQVSELLNRVFGDSVGEDELRDMVLGRPGSGDLRAHINEATRLEAYRTEFKTYEGREPTPDDYAKFRGFAGVAEYKWDITTAEAMQEMGPTIREALKIAFPDEPELSDEDLRIMVGDMKGSGELKAKYREATEVKTEKEKARDWVFQQEGVDIGYSRAEQGGFRVSVPGLGNL